MVCFVGAGPGAVDMITVRGMRELEKADVIIYAGSLVNPQLLTEYARESAEIYDSAKMTLEEVIEVIEQAEKDKKYTVRLHTGEPSLYGAVREQMDELDKRGIEYKSVAGVSACFGAAASLDIEYTLPGVSQSLIITRMEGRTEVPKGETIESFASHGCSMAIYLSSSMTGELSKRLIEGGYSKDTPVAIVYKATWDDEKRYECTLETLEKTAKENGIYKTAVILVGEAVAHRDYKRSKLYDPGFETGYRRVKGNE
ncbi:MAG: precorrin-4 C(11)-methyltransferase [Lachnospiraceae bacterium]|nr:precorrin-4 C(11)-methyltransferase [Lachnospiraceae bacterium]